MTPVRLLSQISTAIETAVALRKTDVLKTILAHLGGYVYNNYPFFLIVGNLFYVYFLQETVFQCATEQRVASVVNALQKTNVEASTS